MTTRATAIGFVAVLLWALLALFTVGSEPVPPLLLNAMTFAIGGVLGLIWAAATGQLHTLRHVPIGVYIFGTLGLWGYHTLYFSALRQAPAAEAGLIAYLWPLLIVLASGLLPGERLRPLHFVGGLCGFAGAAVLLWDRLVGFEGSAAFGYGLAFAAAFTWTAYSVLSRRLGTVPTVAVAVYCLATAALSLPLHFVFETTRWPADIQGWLSVIGLGLGPVGLAFFVWDIGVKRGNIQLLGVASYAAPLLSTMLLVITGVANAKLTLAIASLLIVGGAGLAAWASRTT